ncbi:CLUMA_CG011525, isoform A [Clunio marinus]|uniref:CLUMA_CG011525, isoform A n=1 Tax=Clunio marinus TaxID=568069 RepID=A0A1J1ID00_9DIPT|nr:CLUMA_CG011525, isoform A [Clunio marinus]
MAIIIQFQFKPYALVNVGTDDVAVVNGHPLFFDSLFPSLQSTTPETVISDYRHRKRLDSLIDHKIDSKMEGVNEFSENNAEFYAEVIGKLIGTIRDGITTLIDEVKQRKQQKRKNSINEMNESTSPPSEISSNKILQAMNTIENITNALMNDNESTLMQKASNDANTMTENHEIESKVLTPNRVNANLSDSLEKEDNQIESNQSQRKLFNFAWNDVVQVIPRRTKRNQNEYPKQLAANNVESSFNNYENTTDTWNNQKIKYFSQDDVTWFTKLNQILGPLSNNQIQRKKKLLRFATTLLIPYFHNESIILNDLRTLFNTIDSDETFKDFEGSNLVPSEESSILKFLLIRGNSTFIQLTPKLKVRIFYQDTDEYSQLRKRTKAILQYIFYKYVRLYLIARKGYKDARHFNRMAKKMFPEENQTSSLSFISQAKFQSLQSSEELKKEFNNNEDFIVASNHARRNFQNFEAIAILIIEIFGAFLGLTLGAMHHIDIGLF